MSLLLLLDAPVAVTTEYANGSIGLVAFGTGSLANADSASIYALIGTTPTIDDFHNGVSPQASRQQPTMVWNPDTTSFDAWAPYYPNIRTGIPIRVRCHNVIFLGDGFEDIAHGYVDSYRETWNPAAKYAEVEISASCSLGALATTTVYDFAAPQESSSARIKRAIQAAGLRVDSWLDPYGATPTADSFNVQAATVTGIAGDHIHSVEDTEGGLLVAGKAHGEWLWMPNGYFANGSGYTVVTLGDSEWTSHSGNLEYPLYTPEPYADNERLYNLIQVTRDGGNTMTAADAASRRKNGLRSQTYSTLHVSDTDSLALANDLLDRPGNLTPDPLRRYDSVTTRLLGTEGTNGSDLIVDIVTREIGNQIRIIRRPPGTDTTDTSLTPSGAISSVHMIQGIELKVDYSVNAWYVTFTLMPGNID